MSLTSSQTQYQYITYTAKDSDSDSENGDTNILRNTVVRNCQRLTAVPDFDGRRYCRVCQDFLPLIKFPRGQRRFTCKTHFWLRVGKRAQQRLTEQPKKRMLSRIWMRLYKDRCVFGHTVVKLKQTDINSFLPDTDLDENADVNEILTKLNDICIMPIYPKSLLDKENVVVVDRGARSQLLQAYREGGEQRYLFELSLME